MTMEWISVKERLPEDGTEVLIWILYANCPIQAYRRGADWYGSGETRDYMDDGFVQSANIKGHDITHWMQLPESPFINK